MPRSNAVTPKLFSVQSSVTKTATYTSSAFAMPLGDTYSLFLNVSAASGTSPTMDIVLQTSVDGGTTYIDLPLRYAQKTTTGAAVLVFKCGLGNNEVALENAAADTGGTLAKNCVFDWRYMKIKATIGGTNPSFTFAIYGLATPSNWNNS